MYQDDNGGKLVPNHDGGVTSFDQSWVPGWLNFAANNTANTNALYLLAAKIGPYTRTTGIYKCPADIYQCTEWGQKMDRVRSVGMNGFIEGGVYTDHGGNNNSHWYSGWWSYNKITDINNPPPSMLWVFVDEHPDSINDGWTIMNVTDPNNWTDLPASYHNGACGFGFADGHGEVHKWLEQSTKVRVSMGQYNGFPAPKSRDIAWIIPHTSARSR
jgi:hypothetical protein